MLLEAKAIDPEKIAAVFAEEYKWLGRNEGQAIQLQSERFGHHLQPGQISKNELNMSDRIEGYLEVGLNDNDERIVTFTFKR